MPGLRPLQGPAGGFTALQVVHAPGGLSMLQAVVMSALQGFTELFPFSSLGIQVIVPKLLRWSFDESNAQFLPFVVSLHVGTALGLIVYFWRQWVTLARAFWTSLGDELRHVRDVPDQRLAWLLIVATIPAGLVGLALQHPLARLFAAPLAAAVMLIINALIMAVGERLTRVGAARSRGGADAEGGEHWQHMTFPQAVGIGVAQVFALIPGLSRSGTTITGGLAVGLSYEDAARFSFLLATPIILAAGVLEVRHLHGGAHGLLHQAALGFVVAGVVAYFSVRYLMRYFHTRRLLPLAVISAAAGVVFTALLLAGL